MTVFYAESPKTKSYRICKTNTATHLNGVITLVDFGDQTGLASVYVSECKNGSKKPQWHICSEHVTFNEVEKVWKTSEPHTDNYGNRRDWYFVPINNINEGIGNLCNGRNNYASYIIYDIVNEGEEPWQINTKSINDHETGTGGNGDG